MNPGLPLARCLIAVALTAALTAGAGAAPAAEAAASRPTTARATSTRAVATAATGEGNRLTTQAKAREELESTRVSGRKGPAAGGVIADWLQPLAALAVVIALIFLLRAVLKRLTGRRRTTAGTGVVEVLCRTHLGGRCEVCLVRVGKRLLLVGLGTAGPVTLCEIRDELEAQALLAELGQPSGRGGHSGAVREVAEKIRSRLSSDANVQD
ncbi:MAG: flagellar biosynthetic protein FliO [Phycisphaerae bacterium]|nr:flagellar biosynthetic protein FliO [Phycisphaerae bacterium]